MSLAQTLNKSLFLKSDKQPISFIIFAESEEKHEHLALLIKNAGGLVLDAQKVSKADILVVDNENLHVQCLRRFPKSVALRCDFVIDSVQAGILLEQADYRLIIKCDWALQHTDEQMLRTQNDFSVAATDSEHLSVVQQIESSSNVFMGYAGPKSPGFEIPTTNLNMEADILSIKPIMLPTTPYPYRLEAVFALPKTPGVFNQVAVKPIEQSTTGQKNQQKAITKPGYKYSQRFLSLPENGRKLLDYINQGHLINNIRGISLYKDFLADNPDWNLTWRAVQYFVLFNLHKMLDEWISDPGKLAMWKAALASIPNTKPKRKCTQKQGQMLLNMIKEAEAHPYISDIRVFEELIKTKRFRGITALGLQRFLKSIVNRNNHLYECCGVELAKYKSGFTKQPENKEKTNLPTKVLESIKKHTCS